MDLFQMHCKALRLPIPEKEYRFTPLRRWRVDYFFANGVRPLVVEIEGGTWAGKSRHTTGSGFAGDLEKYNTLSIMGISLLRFTPGQVKRGIAALTVKRWFDAHSKA